jgi:hypothetical protein
MSNIRHISEFDVFFLSYDEPNAEENWADLSNLCPWAQRIQGVKGLDEVHKAAARVSETERFLTVDGDTRADAAFFDLELDFDNPKFQATTLSWAGRNHVNGLIYGNGGLKLWWRQNVLDMKTHEKAEKEEEKVDFCWHDNYRQMNDCFSTTYPNGSPYQAFRSGFREGVKMSLDQGIPVDKDRYEESIWPVNYRRLLTWATVGADVPYGIWSIYGTRLGIYQTMIEDEWDFGLISDYDWMKEFFQNEACNFDCSSTNYCGSSSVKEATAQLGRQLRHDLRIQLVELDEEQSEFFKKVSEGHQRRGAMTVED